MNKDELQQEITEDSQVLNNEGAVQVAPSEDQASNINISDTEADEQKTQVEAGTAAQNEVQETEQVNADESAEPATQGLDTTAREEEHHAASVEDPQELESEEEEKQSDQEKPKESAESPAEDQNTTAKEEGHDTSSTQESEVAPPAEDAHRLDLYIEALIFAAEYALNTEEIRKTCNITFSQNFKKQHIQELIDNIHDKYSDDNFAIQLVGIAGGYLFMTKKKYQRIIGDFLKSTSKRKLSKAALETLSIIAYKQPIAKSEVESIRGVNADYAVQKLLEKELVEIRGRAEGPGRPLLYGTSTKFLNHFGIKDIKELPKLREFETTEDTIGVIGEEE